MSLSWVGDDWSEEDGYASRSRVAERCADCIIQMSGLSEEISPYDEGDCPSLETYMDLEEARLLCADLFRL